MASAGGEGERVEAIEGQVIQCMVGAGLGNNGLWAQGVATTPHHLRLILM